MQKKKRTVVRSLFFMLLSMKLLLSLFFSLLIVKKWLNLKIEIYNI